MNFIHVPNLFESEGGGPQYPQQPLHGGVRSWPSTERAWWRLQCLLQLLAVRAMGASAIPKLASLQPCQPKALGRRYPVPKVGQPGLQVRGPARAGLYEPNAAAYCALMMTK